MSYAWLCSLSLFLLIAGLGDATDYNILDFAMARRHELWMAKYGKVYRDGVEKAMRLEIFKKTVKYVEDYNNAGTHSDTLAVNQFADLTDKEIMDRHTGFKIPEIEFEGHKDFPEALNVSALPSSVDWRDEGAVTSVEKQENCYSCWAIVAAETVEGLVKIKTGVLHDLSAQQLIDCDTGNKHCKAGDVADAYTYIKKNGGLTTSANYPYTDVEGTCDTKKEKKTVAKINGYWSVSENNEPKLKEVVARQPVAVNIDAYTKGFALYKSGIYNGTCTTKVNHAVTVVGYGEEKGKKYWIVKNSWGTEWGESGYAKMARDIGSPEGLCGIAMWGVYPR